MVFGNCLVCCFGCFVCAGVVCVCCFGFVCGYCGFVYCCSMWWCFGVLFCALIFGFVFDFSLLIGWYS